MLTVFRRVLRSTYAVRLLSSSASAGWETPRDPAALLIFHRHGDRSPLRGHTPDEELARPAEPAARCNASTGTTEGEGATAASDGVATAAKTAEEFWRRQLVPGEDVERLDDLYPVRRSPGEAVPPDEESAPFGCLTSVGLQQLRDRGDRFRREYLGDGIIDSSRVRVFSTNYRRTQLSAQGFLDGFLGGKGGVSVVVRPRAEDFLNQWESRGHEMYERMMVLESGAAFRETEENVGGPLKRQLNALDPELFPLPQGGRFRWMMAADYFMSARARGLVVAPELDALGTSTIRHLVWRFGRFYRDEEMMRIMVGPLLSHMLECAADSEMTQSGSGYSAVPRSGSGVRSLSRVVSSSCHDVTVLALLYAMEAHLIENEDYWPPYGCTIAFAISSCREGPVGQEPPEAPDEKGGGTVLEISVDGEPLRSRLFRNHQGKPGAVPLEEFRSAVQNLLPSS
eukprot:g10717.t2